MTAPIPTPNVPAAAIDSELAALERKQASLIAHARALRAANEALRRDLAAANARNQALSARVAEARERLDALLVAPARGRRMRRRRDEHAPRAVSERSRSTCRCSAAISRSRARKPSAAELADAVAFLDRRMREIRESGKIAGAERIAVMAALNLAHDLLRERKRPRARRMPSPPSQREHRRPLTRAALRRRIDSHATPRSIAALAGAERAERVQRSLRCSSCPYTL